MLGPKSASVQTRLDLDPVMRSLDHCDFLVAGSGLRSLAGALPENPPNERYGCSGCQSRRSCPGCSASAIPRRFPCCR